MAKSQVNGLWVYVQSLWWLSPFAIFENMSEM